MYITLFIIVMKLRYLLILNKLIKVNVGTTEFLFVSNSSVMTGEILIFKYVFCFKNINMKTFASLKISCVFSFASERILTELLE